VRASEAPMGCKVVVVGQERQDRRWPTTGKNAIVEQRQEGPRCQESASNRRHGKGLSLVLWSSFSEDDVGVVPSVFSVGTSSLLGVGFPLLVESGFPWHVSLRKASAASQGKRASFIRFDGGMARGGGSSSMWFWDPVCYLHPHLERVDKIFPWQGIRPGGVGVSAYSRRRAFFSKLSSTRRSQRPVSRRRGVSRGSNPFPRSHSFHIYSYLFISISI
jgi:hypothetical protein